MVSRIGAFSRRALLVAGLGVTCSATDLGAEQVAPDSETARLVRGRVEMMRTGLEARAGRDRLLATSALPAFYESRAFRPAWLTDPSLGAIDALRAAVRRAADHGLDPTDYHRDQLDDLLARVRGGRAPATDSADLELIASDAFVVLGSHLLNGRVNPETIDPEWLANRRSAAMQEVLARAVESGAVESALFELAPAQPRYAAMLRALGRMRAVAAEGGWTALPGGPKLELGSTGPRVAALRARLLEGGDLDSTAEAEASEGEDFDQKTWEAVRRFQESHGLEPDGVVGPATLAALNVSAAERASQLEINLERWRWLPADLGRRHIEVNIAGYDVRVVEEGRTVRVHRAVVGRQYRQTPMFSGVMTYLVLSPYWHVPPTIAAVDKFPVIQRAPSEIAAQRMTLLDQRTNRPVDPASVDWSALTGAEFNRRYRLRQDPGPTNALGAVKFMFPNRHNVYLHDTPARELFGRAARSFSSGCIRVEDPLDLAVYLLAGQPGWSRAEIDRVVAAGVERVVPLAEPVPVHLLYWTAWADGDGRIHFRDDIYGRDVKVRSSLLASPPGA